MTPKEATLKAITYAQKANDASLVWAEAYTRQGQLWISIARELREQETPETPA